MGEFLEDDQRLLPAFPRTFGIAAVAQRYAQATQAVGFALPVAGSRRCAMAWR
jgi:hypothetical protein